MKFLYKLERKYGKYAISNLSFYVTMCFVIGYVLQLFLPNVYGYLVFSPYHIFVRHEIWRVFTWIFTTPGGFNVFTLIMLFFYYSVGTSIERALGSFMYNLYIFGGMLLSTVGALISSAICYFSIGDVDSYTEFSIYGMVAGSSMTYYMTISIFLGFALIYSDAMVLLWFIIPFKVKWLAYVDLAFLAYDFVTVGNLICRVTIVSCVLNFFIFYAITRRYNNGRRYAAGKLKRRKTNGDRIRQFEVVDNKASNITRHKCAVCGRSEKDNPELEFRFCSKCNGNYEYCSDHLYTHEHIK